MKNGVADLPLPPKTSIAKEGCKFNTLLSFGCDLIFRGIGTLVKGLAVLEIAPGIGFRLLG